MLPLILLRMHSLIHWLIRFHALMSSAAQKCGNLFLLKLLLLCSLEMLSRNLLLLLILLSLTHMSLRLKTLMEGLLMLLLLLKMSFLLMLGEILLSSKNSTSTHCLFRFALLHFHLLRLGLILRFLLRLRLTESLWIYLLMT